MPKASVYLSPYHSSLPSLCLVLGDIEGHSAADLVGLPAKLLLRRAPLAASLDAVAGSLPIGRKRLLHCLRRDELIQRHGTSAELRLWSKTAGRALTIAHPGSAPFHPRKLSIQPEAEGEPSSSHQLARHDRSETKSAMTKPIRRKG